MKPFRSLHKRLATGQVTTALLFAIVTCAVVGVIGVVAPSGASIAPVGLADGVGFERHIRIVGNVVCAECSLEEMRKVLARRGPLDLYELRDGQQQIVVEAMWISHARVRNAPPHRLWVHGPDAPLAQLAAEKNWFRNIELTGILRHPNVLDIYQINIQ